MKKRFFLVVHSIHLRLSQVIFGILLLVAWQILMPSWQISRQILHWKFQAMQQWCEYKIFHGKMLLQTAFKLVTIVVWMTLKLTEAMLTKLAHKLEVNREQSWWSGKISFTTGTLLTKMFGWCRACLGCQWCRKWNFRSCSQCLDKLQTQELLTDPVLLSASVDLPFFGRGWGD